jgi:hypothetical protein
VRHHPLCSNAPHGDSDARSLPLSPSPSLPRGGGASITKLKKPECKPYSESTYGFSHLLVTKDKLTLRHIDPAQEQPHAFTRNLAGKVDIIT